MIVSKDERYKFRFIGWDVEKYEDGVRDSMKEYAQSLNEIKEIRRADRNKKLLRIELMEYRKFCMESFCL